MVFLVNIQLPAIYIYYLLHIFQWNYKSWYYIKLQMICNSGKINQFNWCIHTKWKTMCKPDGGGGGGDDVPGIYYGEWVINSWKQMYTFHPFWNKNEYLYISLRSINMRYTKMKSRSIILNVRNTAVLCDLSC